MLETTGIVRRKRVILHRMMWCTLLLGAAFAASALGGVSNSAPARASVPAAATSLGASAGANALPTGKPGGPFPSEASPRDGHVFLIAEDMSCDEITKPSSADLQSFFYAAATAAAWSEGTLAVTGVRANTINSLHFAVVSFHSDKRNPEAVRRDLQKQRNDVDVSQLVASVEAAGHGECHSDLIEAMREYQLELSSLGAGGHPVTLVVVSNGIVAARGTNFCTPQPRVSKVVQTFRQAGEIAHLPGVQIVFVDVGHAPCVTAAKLNWLYGFWSAYAKAADASPAFVSSTTDLIARWRIS